MKIYYGLNDPSLKCEKRALAIGVFDGVHAGHQKILSQMLQDAHKHLISPMVVTFDPHPAKILFPKKNHPSILMSLQHRLSFFESLGIKEALVIPFTADFSKMSREDFFIQLLIQKLGLQSLAVGHDFRFGHKGLGTTGYLKEKCKMFHRRFYVIPAFKSGGETISSTRIRVLIEKGDLVKAGHMLGRPVSVVGTVEHGHGRGKSIGFPTANLNPHHEALPPAGVYAAYGFLEKKKLRGVISIGPRPTFGEKEAGLEVHFLRFDQNIYGRQVEMIFVKKLRDIKRFASPQLLGKAIAKDIQSAQKLL